MSMTIKNHEDIKRFFHKFYKYFKGFLLTKKDYIEHSHWSGNDQIILYIYIHTNKNFGRLIFSNTKVKLYNRLDPIYSLVFIRFHQKN